jgi:hypothetical protein
LGHHFAGQSQPQPERIRVLAGFIYACELQPNLNPTEPERTCSTSRARHKKIEMTRADPNGDRYRYHIGCSFSVTSVQILLKDRFLHGP